MAMILKDQATWDYKGVPLSNAYGVIDHLNANKRDRRCHLVFEIYADESLRGDPGNLLAQYSYDVTLDDFDTWFSVPTLSGQNPFKQAYLWLAALEDEDGNLVWGEDWESDE